VAVFGEQPDALALALDDEPITVMLDLVKPIRAGRDFGPARRNARFERWFTHLDKIVRTSKNANPLDQPKRQLPPGALMALDKILNRRWNVAHLHIAASTNFKGYIFRNVLRPTLGGVEGDDAYWVRVLAGKQVLDDGFEVGPLIVCLAPGASYSTEIVSHQIDRLIVAARYDGRRPIGLTHLLTTNTMRPDVSRGQRSAGATYGAGSDLPARIRKRQESVAVPV
jgi:hypothetical protein